MDIKDRIKQEGKVYFDTRANFEVVVCRLIADELDDVYIGRAIDRRYIDYIDDCLSEGLEIQPFEIWLNNLETKNYSRLIEIARAGFRDVVLKTFIIWRIVVLDGTSELDKSNSLLHKLTNMATTYRVLVSAVFLLGLICGILAASYFGYSTAEIGEILEDKILAVATAQ